ncbi:hypothetical protein K432DRAFT_354524 [Lepidopterella palustris CBS 459.81]|uniref:DUF7730 domain-containing protein n=1 Tax=Lepidopterella palustris CBS 459.81 TaxID=1314670 RepID=A0A8E2E8Z8_9PEZI|nr:hypothetical protein K432DRAFT_354524 [Lepidopterella palustris CBS 459.81]
MADSSITPSAYSKRKRPQISYYEGDTDDDDWYKSDDSIDEFSPNKVRPQPLPKHKIFPFLSLPAELRNLIYGYALVDDFGVFLRSKTKHYRRTVERGISDGLAYSLSRYSRRRRYLPQPMETIEPEFTLPSFLVLNRQIYTEALPILYSNKFILEDTTALHAFIANLTPTNRALLENITIRRWGCTKSHKALNHPGLTMLVGCVNLKHLSFDCRIGLARGPKRIARQIYRDGFHWFEAVGTAKGKFDAAVELVDLCAENWQRAYWQRAYWRREQDQFGQTADENLGIFRDELRKLLSEGMGKKRRTRKSRKKANKV